MFLLPLVSGRACGVNTLVQDTGWGSHEPVQWMPESNIPDMPRVVLHSVPASPRQHLDYRESMTAGH